MSEEGTMPEMKWNPGPGAARTLRIVGITVAAATLAAALGTIIVNHQMTRHRRGLFSGNTLQRLAALGYLAQGPATVEAITLLRDFISWERRRLLRGQARSILRRMEREAQAAEGPHMGRVG